MNKKHGLLFVLSSPSGGGKTTITKALLQRNPALTLSVSVTTRAPRPHEVDGKDYHFISQETFISMRDQDAFVEWAEVFGNFYGTPKAPLEKAIEHRQKVLLDLDWQGRASLYALFPKQTVTIFIAPPSLEELERRLRARVSDSEEVIALRMKEAEAQMAHAKEYGHVVINDDLECAIEAVENIILQK